MEFITRREILVAAAAGEYSGKLPEPVTREEYYLKKICERLDNITKTTDEQIQAVINNYLIENSIVFNTSEDITEVLHG